MMRESNCASIRAVAFETKKVPGAQRAVIADAGHAANIDQPEAFNAAVEAFLAGL